MQSASEDVKKSKAWTLLRNAYLLLQMASFSSELTCVFTATHAIAALQMTSIDLTAGSLSQMLIRELEYEYVGVRTGFTTGLLAFTAAQAIRVRYALRRSRDLSWCAMWFLISAACSLLTYNNATTLTYGGYTGLLSRWTLLHSQLICTRRYRSVTHCAVAVGGSGSPCVAAAMRPKTSNAWSVQPAWAHASISAS